MPVLRKAKRCCSHRAPSVVSVESMGLNLIEARRLFDEWLSCPSAPAVMLARRAEIKSVSRGERYILANRAKWASFCAQAHPEREPPLESKLQATLIKMCKAEGWWAYKSEAPGFAGLPDVQVLKPSGSILKAGQIAFVEMKRTGERPSKLQEHVIGQLNYMGFFAFWSDDPVQAFAYLKRVWTVHRKRSERR